MADHAPQIAPDGIYDADRVLRLPSSINGRSGKLVSYEFNLVSPTEPLVYDMEDIVKRLGLCPGILVSIAIAGLLHAHALKCVPTYPCESNDTPVEALAELAYDTVEVPRHSATGLAKFFDLPTDECRAMALSTPSTRMR